MKHIHKRPGLEKRALVVRLRKIKGQIEAIEKWWKPTPIVPIY